MANIQDELETLLFEEGFDWHKHVSTFLSIMDELGSLDHAISEKEKVSKFLQTHPPAFDALAMACILDSHSFEEHVSAVKADFERHKKLGTWKATDNKNVAFIANISNWRQYPFKPARGRGKFSFCGNTCGDYFKPGFIIRRVTKVCHYCGKLFHFIKLCRLRVANEGQDVP